MLLQIHWDVAPTIFRWGPLAPRWYGLLFALGFLIGFYLMRHVFEREGKPEQDLDFLLFYLLGGTILGARLGHILFYAPGYYFSNPLEIPMIQRGGLASHGGLIGVVLAIWIYCQRREDQPFLWLLDRLAAPVALTGSLIRLGNFFNSEILGTLTDLPWGVVFERAARVRNGIEATPLHPVQLYESICYFLFFVLLWRLYQRWGPDTPRGMLIGMFFTFVFGVRIVLEFFKMRQIHFEAGLPLGLSMGQLLSIPVVALGIWLWSRASASSSATVET
jgi:prolipoprotein diacylglyceryl transferase